MMKSKRYFFAGMVALFLVSIIGFVSCEDEPKYNYNEPKYSYEWVFRNRSRYTIQVDIDPVYSISPRSFNLRPGVEKKCGTNTYYTEISLTWYRTDTNDGTGVIFDSGTFSNQ